MRGIRCFRRGRLAILVLAGVLAAGVGYVAVNTRDGPPPDTRDLAPPVTPVPGSNSNGWFFIREAVRDAIVPAGTSRLHAVWLGAASDPALARELLISNQLALAWVDRAANAGQIAPPAVRLPEDGNYLAWSPVALCGKLLRLRAAVALNEGRAGDALTDHAEALRLARLYVDCPPLTDLDALAAFTEIRNALLGLRLASSRIGVPETWARFNADLEALSDLREARRRASAMALAHDRQEMAVMRAVLTGQRETISDGGIMATMLPGDRAETGESWIEQAGIRTLRALPASFQLHSNDTLAVMADVRRGKPLSERQLLAGSRGVWHLALHGLGRQLRPNGVGRIYAEAESERQGLIDGGSRLAECAARGTRLALALRLCARQKGQLPETLDDLVPGWLRALPLDPYAGQPFHYDRARALVYSAGSNKQDNGGRRDDVLFPIPP